jgi:hypothetical protein
VCVRVNNIQYTNKAEGEKRKKESKVKHWFQMCCFRMNSGTATQRPGGRGEGGGRCGGPRGGAQHVESS